MGDRDDRPAARRARTGSAAEPDSSGPGAAATQRPEASAPGLEDALHGAPDLLALLTVVPGLQPNSMRPPLRGDHRPSHDLRLVSQSCCLAVDSATTSLKLALYVGDDNDADSIWLEHIARRLAKMPRLVELKCCEAYGPELEPLLATAAAAQPSAVAGVQTLWVSAGAQSDMFGPYLPALLRSLAYLPSLQVRASGWPEAACALCVGGYGQSCARLVGACVRA
jgi:hypothetical protein